MMEGCVMVTEWMFGVIWKGLMTGGVSWWRNRCVVFHGDGGGVSW